MQVSGEALLEKNLEKKTIVFQTEGCYAVGCLLNDEVGIEKIYAITKQRKKTPFTVLVGNMSDAYGLVKYPKRLKPYAQFYWPGDAALITEKSTRVTDITSRGDTVALKLSDDALAKRISNHFGPLVVTCLLDAQANPVTEYEAALVFENTVDYVVKGENLETRTSFMFDIDRNKTVF